MKRIVRSAMADLMPSGGPVPGVLDVGWDTFVDRYRQEVTRPVWAGVVLGSVVYTLSPVLTVGRPVPSFALSPALRNEHANRITSHRIYLVRQAVFLLKLSAGFAWGADPAVRRSLNLEPYGADPGSWRE